MTESGKRRAESGAEVGKQYLVVRVKGEHGSMLNLVPVAGLLPIEAAQQSYLQAVQAEPDATFVIQEVGAA